ncbi:MAG TPA: hemerythrin domain-containing protein [Anaeromyxobacter sp.]
MAQHNSTSGDAISVLKNDHQAVEQLFRRFERTKSAADRKRLADRMVRELSIHTAIEEQLVYPMLRRRLDGRAPGVLLALEEHHLAKLALVEIERLGPDDERFEPKVRVLIDNVRRHVQEEERDLLPAMKRTLSPEEVQSLGAALVRAKASAPTRPHPGAPDEPPANALANVGAAAYDRSRDAIGRGIARVLDRSRDVVEQALRRGELAARQARQRLGRGLERAGREVRPDAH